MAKLLEQLTNIWTARVLVMFGLVAGYVPISATFDHIGDPDSLLTETSFLQSHSYYHFFREGVGDLTAQCGDPGHHVPRAEVPQPRDVVDHAAYDVRLLRTVLDRRSLHG